MEVANWEAPFDVIEAVGDICPGYIGVEMADNGLITITYPRGYVLQGYLHYSLRPDGAVGMKAFKRLFA